MKKLILNPTDTSQWHALVNEAQMVRSCTLAEDLESYLVFLLMRFMEQPKIASSVLAVDFIDGISAVGKARYDKLRDLGDKSLLFSGLFPDLAKKKRVNVNYFVEIGQSAYSTLSFNSEQNMAELFSALCNDFLTLRSVLQAMRELSIRKAMDLPESMLGLWQTMPSEEFLEVLRQYTDALIIPPGSGHDDKEH
ncbi:MAG: hypothetical protein V3V61_06125 [Gammaproteobacteria bacterium]